MLKLYIMVLEPHLPKVKELLKTPETVGTDTYCFKPDTYVIDNIKDEDRNLELIYSLQLVGAFIPLQ